MKKIGLSIVLALMLIVSGTRPAPALMVDVTQIIQKVTSYIQKLSDCTQKISQQINQIKLMATQGFDLSQLRDMADDFFIKKISISLKMHKLVTASKGKKRDVMIANQELYRKGATDNYNAKYSQAEIDLGYLQGELAAAQARLSATIPECAQKYTNYEMEDRVVEKDTKWGIYVECKTRQDLYASQVEELSAAVADMEGVMADQKSKEIRADVGDKNYKERKKHKETLEEAQDKNESSAYTDGDEEAIFPAAHTEGEWDTEGNAKSQQQDREYYRIFARRYFYDPDDPRFQGDGWGKEKTVRFQSNLDRLNRERRFLYINSAAHLMQAASTARREIAKRMKGEDRISAETSEGPNEYDAMSSYTATRIENIKALLLYAQVQSVKLQYLAAKELLHAELRKKSINKNVKFDKIDLGKYLMEGE